MAILCAVLVVAVVTATNDYSKDEQFRALNAVKDDVNVQASPGLPSQALFSVDTTVRCTQDIVRVFLLLRPINPPEEICTLHTRCCPHAPSPGGVFYESKSSQYFSDPNCCLPLLRCTGGFL